MFVVLGLLEVQALGRRLPDRRRTGWRGGDRRSNGNRCAITDVHAGSLRHERANATLLLAFTSVSGLKTPREWGVIAFVLNLYPLLALSLLPCCPPCSQLHRFETLYAALIVIVGLNHLQSVIGSYIESRVAGTAVSVCPAMVC
jgi:hypothetical protein